MEINPWVSIWTNPRQTIREIVNFNPNHRLFLLSVIYGFGSLLSISQNFYLGYHLNLLTIVLASLILSPLWGYIVFSIASFFVSFTGKWLGGQATFKQIRSAIAWSNVPMLVNVAIWIILLFIFGVQLFQEFPGGALANKGQFWALFTFLVLQLAVAIWALVIYLLALSEVQQFSIWRTIGNVLLAGIIISVLFFALAYLVGLITVFKPAAAVILNL